MHHQQFLRILMPDALKYSILLFMIYFSMLPAGCGSSTSQNHSQPDITFTDLKGKDAETVADIIEDSAAGEESAEIVECEEDYFQDEEDVFYDGEPFELDSDILLVDQQSEAETDTSEPCSGYSGCPCQGNSECYIGLCIETIDKWECATKCQSIDECPAGWECIGTIIGSDPINICAPPYPRLCRPCLADLDCSDPYSTDENLCIVFGPEGKFCGAFCENDDFCPEKYKCKETKKKSGVTIKQCVPEDNVCECTQKFITKGYLTECFIENPSGKCIAQKTCDEKCPAKEPAEEACDYEDNDCDGKTDEDIDGKPCPLKNQYGTCMGTAYCINGNEICQGTEAKPEECNNYDDNCDGKTDEEGSGGCTDYYPDYDGDGFGFGEKKCLCESSGVTNNKDCDDSNKDINPDAPEKCNDIDDNCNGATDEEGAVDCKDFYYDEDGDGYGKQDKKCLCDPVWFYTAIQSGDCDDLNPDMNPSAKELCSTPIDDNCNQNKNDPGSEDCNIYYKDVDGDNFGTEESQCLCYKEGLYSTSNKGDCNDSDPLINPGKIEICGDNIDNDCSGSQNDENALGSKPFYQDNDGDGFGTDAFKNLCIAVPPFTAAIKGDCDDNDKNINPGAAEICNNGKDDNCDSTQDTEGAKGCLIYYWDEDMDNYGDDGNKKCLCAKKDKYTAEQGGDCDDNNPEINKGLPETCNGLDDNCNKLIDDGTPSQLCGSIKNGTPKCANSKCVIDTCGTGFYDVDEDYATGCECQWDKYEPNGNTPDNPVVLNNLSDEGNGSSFSITASLVGGSGISGTGDVDYYKFSALDSSDVAPNPGGPYAKDNFHVTVKFTGTPDSDLAMKAYEENIGNELCGSQPNNEFSWQTDFYSSSAGEAPCSTVVWNNPPGQAQPGTHYCQNNSRTFIIKVFRKANYPKDCSKTTYTVEFSNGLYNSP